jgi:hypothetical protein
MRRGNLSSVTLPPPRKISKNEAWEQAWHHVTLRLKVRIQRENFDKILTFNLDGAQYNMFCCLAGTFNGVDDNGHEFVITLNAKDIIEIIEDNRDEAKAGCEKLADSILRDNDIEVTSWYEKRKEIKNAKNGNSFWKRVFGRADKEW